MLVVRGSVKFEHVPHGLYPLVPHLDLFEQVECRAALVECVLSPFVPLGLGTVECVEEGEE